MAHRRGLMTLCAMFFMGLLMGSAPALAQGLPWNTDTLRRGDEVRAGVQHRTEDGVRRERLRFASPEEAKAWALETLADPGQGGKVLVEVRGKRAVRLTGQGLEAPDKVRKALQEAWGEERAEEGPELLALRADRKVALFGSAVPQDPASKLPPDLQLDPQAARPLQAVLEERKVELPAPAPTSGFVDGLSPG